ncbi:hypothetical protein PN36_04025 [Candidatus Thiomargarita nelsonii]|uniref:Antitoxin n=1 Tax=Candidatus Thiomargarita nelsonii TaxID=1003181 RepID=A0A0A6PQM4_9GAMM|nr:hypothetical protein PN36_04025 [Candidatus Thiomargarita nelsonii]
MLNINVTEFESHLNQIVSRVEAGENIIITRLGEPIIRLSAVKKTRQGSDQLLMTTEKLDDAVDASKRILKEAAQGKLPRYICT